MTTVSRASPRPFTSVFVRSVYFYDPNGIMLELAAWTRPLHAGDVRHAPATATPARVLEPAA